MPTSIKNNTNLIIKYDINKLNYFLFGLGKQHKHSHSYAYVFNEMREKKKRFICDIL